MKAELQRWKAVDLECEDAGARKDVLYFNFDLIFYPKTELHSPGVFLYFSNPSLSLQDYRSYCSIVFPRVYLFIIVHVSLFGKLSMLSLNVLFYAWEQHVS